MIDERIIEQIIESNDIVSVVEQYLPLKKTGSNFKACCPFHEENTPSFVVSDKKQIYKCFGCGRGGNVIHFVKEMEKISFFEALSKLAAKAGITLKQETEKTKIKRSRTSLMQTVYELAKDYYRSNLDKFGDPVISYLAERGISKEMIDKFELGYALNSANGLYNYLLKNHINKDIMLNSGLISSGKYGTYDTFKERLIFPIHSSTGKVVAFGARILSDKQSGGKYINSPTTDIYTKGNELYGFFLTKHEIGRKNSAIITEGYLDFIRLYEAGFTNSVAALGTAITDKQIKLISRYTQNFYLLFDGDKAGKKAAVEAAKKIITAGQTPLIVVLPPDHDADSYLQSKGEDNLNELITKSKSLPQFLADDSSLQLSDKEKIRSLAELIGNISDILSAELFTKQIAETFNVSTQALLSGKRRQKVRTTVHPGERISSPDSRFLEEKVFLIHLINGNITDGEMMREISKDYFFVESYKKIFELFAQSTYNIDSSRVMSVMNSLEDTDPALVSIISELSLADSPQIPVESAIIDLKLRKLKSELNDNNLSDENGREKIIERVRKLEERNSELKKLSNRVVKRIF